VVGILNGYLWLNEKPIIQSHKKTGIKPVNYFFIERGY